MLADLISAEKINEAYQQQINTLIELGVAEFELAEAEFQLQKAIARMYDQPDFKPGKNDMERSAQIEQFSPSANSIVIASKAKVDQLKNEYRVAGLNVDKYQALIKYMEAIKDLPQFPVME